MDRLEIDYYTDEASFGDLSGCDIEATMRAYNDVLFGELQSKFPGVIVAMHPADSYNGGKIVITGAPGDEEEEAIREMVDEISLYVLEALNNWWIIPTKGEGN